MGNKVSSINQTEARSSSPVLRKYKLQADISIDESTKIVEEIYKGDENSYVLTWNKYFSLLEKQLEINRQKNEQCMRKFAHPSTLNYVAREKRAIKPKSENNNTAEEIELYSSNDYYTDDSASEASTDHHDASLQGSAMKTVNNQTRIIFRDNENTEIMHPAFFGNSWESVEEFEIRRGAKMVDREERCRRAVEIARKFRTDAVEQLQKRIMIQRIQREKKMTDIASKFDKETNDLRTQFERDIVGANNDFIMIMKDQMDQRLAIIQAAFDSETSYLRKVHDDKCRNDDAQLEIRKGELRALIELLEPAAPLADQLERFARIELGRLSTALNEALNMVDKMKDEFLELRNDTLNELDIQNQNASAMRKNRELRSMLNVAETKLKEAIRSAKDIEQELLDAEALMQKAIDLRGIEDVLSPFFFAFEIPPSSKDKAYANKRSLSLALILLAKGSFDQKISALLRVYNNKQRDLPDRWNLDSIKNIFRENISVLQKLGLIYVVDSEIASLEEFLVRCFLELTLYRREDVISLFELQQLVLYSIVRIPELCKLFQVSSISPRIASYSVFQIHSMKAVSFLQLNTVSIVSVAHASFLQSLRYRSKLQLSQKRNIHDLALACGANDPYKVDFGKFLSRGMKKSSYRVPPLDNGRNTSLWAFQSALQSQAVIKIQSVVRSFVARRKFERASLEAAYSEARQSALQLAKTKILREFQQREGGKGIGKMKWDAEVRIQQAKFRAQGKTLSRSDTVMLMVEAAIAEAQQLVEQRFRDILPTALQLQNNVESYANSRKSRSSRSGHADFGVNGETSVDPLSSIAGERALTPIEQQFGFDVGKLYPRIIESKVSMNKDNTNDISVNVTQPRTTLPIPYTLVDAQMLYANILQMIQTSDIPRRWFFASSAQFGNGESVLPQLTRIFLGRAEYTATHNLQHILTLLHPNLTLFKASELTAEFPSKRLLSHYLLFNELTELQEDFVSHFKFPRKFATSVIQSLRKFMLQSDEAGRLLQLCNYLQQQIDQGLTTIFRNSLLADAKTFKDYVEQKATNQHGDPSQILLAEYDVCLETGRRLESEQWRLAKEVQNSIKHVQSQIYATRNNERKSRLQRLTESLLSERDVSLVVASINDENLVQNSEKMFLCDTLAQLTQAAVPQAVRYDWWGRLQGLEKLMNTDISAYYFALEQLLSDFISVATDRAKCLVNEMFADESCRTIPTHSIRSTDGRNHRSGRGLPSGEGCIRRIFSVDNLFLDVCLDGDGSCNGNDEIAAKQAAQEVLAAQLVTSASIHKLRVPLSMTVDCHGVRVFVSCRVPIDILQLSDDGAIQNESQEVLHDLQRNGRFFVNQSRIAHSHMRLLAQRLNISEHAAKGLDDLATSNTFAAYLKIYRGADGLFYLRRCRALFPREMPSATPHLEHTPRLHSVLWRCLRPELMKKLSSPLSTDVGLIATFDVPDVPVMNSKNMDDDSENHESGDRTGFLSRSICAVKNELLNRIVPEFLERLLSLEDNYLTIPWKQFDLSKEMHREGINMRHLGFMRSFLWRDLPGKFSIFHNEKVARSSEPIEQDAIAGGDYLQLGLDDDGYNEEFKEGLETMEGTNSQLEELTETDQNKNTTRGKFGQGQVMLFEVGDMSLRKSQRYVPLTALYGGEPVSNLRARTGKLLAARRRSDMDILIMSEMVCRVLKQLIRQCWRIHLRIHQRVSTHFQRSVICFFLNLLCSSEEGAGVFGSEILFNNLRERFGSCSVHVYERYQLLDRIRPALCGIIPRLCRMLGVTINPLSLNHFLNCPDGYNFQPQDIAEISETVKMSFPYLPLLRASNLCVQGDTLMQRTFSQLVLNDSPTLFLKLSERKGATVAQNSGSLGAVCCGKISDGCLLQEEGPIVGEKFVKSMGFSPLSESTVDVAFHKRVVAVEATQCFSVELFFSVAGGKDISRVLLDCGRFQVSINRENRISVSLSQLQHTVSLVLDGMGTFVRLNRWIHLAICYDGVNLTIFIDGCEQLSVDLTEIFTQKQLQFETEHMQALQQLENEEDLEKQHLLQQLQEQTAVFFTTKEGQRALKDLIQQFLDRDTENNDDEDNGGNQGSGHLDDEDHANIMRERRSNATKAAKELFLAQQHDAALRNLHERFKQMRLDLEDRRTRVVDQGQLHSYQHLRIGGALPDANNKHGSAYFFGRISCVIVYDTHLSREAVRGHYLASRRDCRRDAFRLFSEAVSSFAVAWKGFSGDLNAPHIPHFLASYSHSICQLFHAQYEEKVEMDRTVAKAALLQLLQVFSTNMMAAPIAEILRHIPRETDFAEVCVAALLALRRTDKNYLFASGVVRDSMIINIPFDFALISPIPRSYEAVQAAAYLLQQISRDRSLAFCLSDVVDLHWLAELRSPAAVVSVALSAYEGDQFRVLKIKHAQLLEQWLLRRLNEKKHELEQQKNNSDTVLFRSHQPLPGINSRRQKSSQPLASTSATIMETITSSTTSNHIVEKEHDMCLLTDADVQTLAEHLPLLQGVDLSHSGRGLTDTAIGELARFGHLRVLVLDGCAAAVTDAALKRLQPLAAQLEILSLADLPQITDVGVLAAFDDSQRLHTLNLSGSSQIGRNAIIQLLRHNPHLTSLGIARLPLTDRCLSNFGDAMTECGIRLQHLDMSFAVDVTDTGFNALLSTPSLTLKLRTLNLQCCQRLTWRSLIKVTHSCWQLEKLELDDVYLLRDQAFAFDNTVDGRAQAQEEMLKRLLRLSVATCHDVTDTMLRYIATQCRQLQSLNLRDTGRFSDTGLLYLCDARLCPYSDLCFAQSLTELNLAFSGRFTSHGLLMLLQNSPRIQRLDLSGLATLVCDELLANVSELCRGLQSLGLAHCPQLSDLALCHLAENLWIEELNLESCHRVTDEGVEVLAEACPGLRSLNLKKARRVTERSVRFVQTACRNMENLECDFI